MTKYNKNIIILIIFLFIIIYFIIFYYKINYYERFYDNQNVSGTFTLNSSLGNIVGEENNNLINYQKGISEESHKGTIYFDKKFDKIPFIFTQIINKPNIVDNGVHSVNISNVTPNSFDYTKNLVNYNLVKSEGSTDNISMMQLSEDDMTTFNWIAFPK